VNAPHPFPSLCLADDATFWPWFASPKLGAWPNREGTVVLLPLVGMADWGLGHALDAEETVLMPLLREACQRVPEGKKPLMVPPLRFVFGADPACAFAVDPPTAHAFIAEVAGSVASSGFRKVVLVNSSPWSEELCSAAARDLRLARNLHMFHIHLSALSLDFHPVRSQSRRDLQTLLTALSGVEPEPAPSAAPAAEPSWGAEAITPLGGTPTSLTEARQRAPSLLAAPAARLAKLLSDIHDRPALAP
jgi:creatinine amidohydrolase